MKIDDVIIARLENNDPTLTYLTFTDYIISADDTARLANALKHNQYLETLVFNDHTLIEAVGVLGEALRVNRSVKSLTLRKMLIDAYDILVLLFSMKGNGTILSLDLSDNNIELKTMSQVEMFAKAINRLPGLIGMNFKGNPVDSDGLSLLIYQLKNNSHLIRIDLWGSFNQAANDYLKRYLSRNTCFQLIKLSVAAVGAIDSEKHVNLEVAKPSIVQEIKKTVNLSQYALSVPQFKLYDAWLDAMLECQFAREKLSHFAALTIETLEQFTRSLNVDYEELSEFDYIKEFSRLLAGSANAKNEADKEAQALAIGYLVQPFHDAYLQKEADQLLMGLLACRLPNGYPEAVLSAAANVIILDLGLRYAKIDDSKIIELNAYAQLINADAPTREEIHALNADPAVCTSEFLNLLNDIALAHALTLNIFIEECRHVLSNALLKQPYTSTLFQPKPLVSIPRGEYHARQTNKA